MAVLRSVGVDRAQRLKGSAMSVCVTGAPSHFPQREGVAVGIAERGVLDPTADKDHRADIHTALYELSTRPLFIGQPQEIDAMVPLHEAGVRRNCWRLRFNDRRMPSRSDLATKKCGETVGDWASWITRLLLSKGTSFAA